MIMIMDFGSALDQLKLGRHVTRWDDESFLFLVSGSTITVERGRPMARSLEVGTLVRYLAHIDRYDGATRTASPYVPTQRDMLERDWRIMPRAQDRASEVVAPSSAVES